MRRMVIALLLIVALASLPLEPAATANASETAGQLQPLPAQFDEAEFQARAAQVIRLVACTRDNPKDKFIEFEASRNSEDPASSEDLMTFLLAKVKQALAGGCVHDNIPDSPEARADCSRGLTRFCLTKQINDSLRAMEVRRLLGTDKVPCLSNFDGEHGDFDMGMRSLLWILYNFPPRPDGIGLERDVYWHVRDQLITVHGLSPYSDGADYSYHISACGNQEKRQGTPAEQVEQYAQAQMACEALGMSGGDCIEPSRAPGDQNEGCFSDLLCSLGFIVFVILALALPPVAAALAAAGAASGVPWLASAGMVAGAVIGTAAFAAVVGAVAVLTVWIPETENHILMIESTRFLSNNLKWRDYRCADPSLATYVCDPANNNNQEAAAQLFDNARNGQARWLLQYLQDLLKRDFLEYNSRPYQRLSGASLLNLYDLACAFENPCSDTNLQIKIAARAVLDYLTAKFAVSNSSLKRLAPFRRLLENKATSEAMFDYLTDFQILRFALLFGTQGIPSNVPLEPPPICEAASADELCVDFILHSMGTLVITAISHYRPPPMLAQMIDVNSLPGGREESGCERYLQRYHHDGEEIYYCERTFLITAGGVRTGAANTVWGIGRPDDAGIALPTTLMPHGYGANWKTDFIRFDGDDDNSPNLCVDRDFACGLNLRIPDAYKDPACYEKLAYWHFIDATKCPGVQAEFYVAAVEHSCASSLACEDVDNFGMFEVVDSRRGTFEAFKAFILATNDGEAAQLQLDRTNRYTRWSGAVVEFDPEEGILNSNADDDLLAEGDVVWADGSGCAVVQNPHLHHSLVLSLVDLNNPYVAFLDVIIPPEEFAASCTNLINFRASDLFDPMH